MTTADITQLIGSVGFPIVMCGYMMVTFNKTLTENTKAINKLSRIVAKITGEVEDDE